MSRDAVVAIGLGAVSASFLLSVVTGTLGALILTYLTPLPLFVVGLSLGLPKLLMAVVAGGAVTTILGLPTTAIFLAVVALPTVILVRQALLNRPGRAGTLDWYPPGLLLSWLAGLAAAGVVATVFWHAGSPGGLVERLRPQLEAALVGFGAGAQAEQQAAVLAQMMPAMMAAIWMLTTAFNGMLAQGLASRFNRALRPSPRLDSIELPWQLLAAFGVSVVASMLPGDAGLAGRSLVVVFAIPFFFQGLALIHALARGSAYQTPMLVGFYLLLLISGGLIAVIAALGVIEQFAHFRRRLGGSGGGEEDN